MTLRYIVYIMFAYFTEILGSVNGIDFLNDPLNRSVIVFNFNIYISSQYSVRVCMSRETRPRSPQEHDQEQKMQPSQQTNNINTCEDGGRSEFNMSGGESLFTACTLK